jgi:diketogulonate reductase-like aldo/keto reductase
MTENAPITRRDLLARGTAAALALTLGPEIMSDSQDQPNTRPIPSSGERIPVVGLGTWQTFDVGDRPHELAPLRDVLSTFVQLGGRVIDSSPMYGRAESVVGRLVQELGLRQGVFLATKVWTRGAAAGESQMNTSFQRLRAQALDLMQVHNLLDAETHLETLRRWKADGRIRFIGVTHYTASAYPDLERLLSRYPLDFVQLNYSLAEREAEQRLLPTAENQNVAVIVNRPFAEGALFRAVRGRQLPAWTAEAGIQSWAQLFLKWIVGHPAVTCVIPATSNPAHLRDNMGALQGPIPDANLRKRIADLFDGG